jgi:hypothetical protein
MRTLSFKRSLLRLSIASLPIALAILPTAGGCGGDELGASSSGGANDDAAGSSGSSGTSGSSGASGSSGSSGSSGASGSSGSSGSSGASGSSGSSGSSGASGSSGSSGSSGAIIDAGMIPDVSFTYDAPVRGDGAVGDACAQTSANATLTPLDMFVMLDRSSSMGADCNIGATTGSKWCRSVNALSAYFTSADATGNAAALQFFPLSPNTTYTCAGAGYSNSTSPGGATGFTGLPSAAFDTVLNTQTPAGGNTPTEGASRGIAGFVGNTLNRRAGRQTIGILITDGDPTACDTDLNNLSNVLATAYGATNVRTFVIGMTGANFANLETVAAGGNAPLHNSTIGALTNLCGNGAATCRHWNVGDGSGAVFVEALKAISRSAIGCSYNMPTTMTGVIDPAKVNVEYLMNGVTPVGLTRVNNLAACVANGWYYDNNTTPTKINLCPAQCTTVQGDANAQVKVILGCLGG